MKIDFNKRFNLDELYIHDSIFKNLIYNYDKREIKFSCDNKYLNQKFNFIFNNVLFYSMQSCSFWNGGNRILDVSYVEKSPEMMKLVKIQNEYKELYECSYLNKEILYLTIEFQLNSGDVLLIICESVDFNSEKL